MAKDKLFEKEYKSERLRRTVRRKAARRDYRRSQMKYKTETCPYCGGEMTWCSCCEMYSSYCCEEYGTCMCS